jgi:hypothetical protein
MAANSHYSGIMKRQRPANYIVTKKGVVAKSKKKKRACRNARGDSKQTATKIELRKAKMTTLDLSLPFRLLVIVLRRRSW